MPVVQILQLDTGMNIEGKNTLEYAQSRQNSPNAPRSCVVGTVQEPNSIQIASEWNNTNDSEAFTNNIHDMVGSPLMFFHVNLSRSAFDGSDIAKAPVVEYVQSWFSTSRLTSEFQDKILADFTSFDDAFSKVATGNLGWVWGWTVEEEQLDATKDSEEARSFFVMRGWDSMDDFTRAVQTDAYKEAIKPLYAWNAPFKMWHVERKL